MIRIGYIAVAMAAVIAAVSCKGALGDYDAEGYFETTDVTVSAEANGRILFFNALMIHLNDCIKNNTSIH